MKFPPEIHKKERKEKGRNIHNPAGVQIVLEVFQRSSGIFVGPGHSAVSRHTPAVRFLCFGCASAAVFGDGKGMQKKAQARARREATTPSSRQRSGVLSEPGRRRRRNSRL